MQVKITIENLAFFSSCIEENKVILVGFSEKDIYPFIMDKVMETGNYTDWEDLQKTQSELTEFMRQVYPLIDVSE